MKKVSTKKASTLLISGVLASSFLTSRMVQAQETEGNTSPVSGKIEEVEELAEKVSDGVEAQLAFEQAHIQDLFYSAANRADVLKVKVSEYLNGQQYKEEYAKFAQNVSDAVQSIIQEADAKGVSIDSITTTIAVAESRASEMGITVKDYFTTGKYKEDGQKLSDKAGEIGQLIVQKAEALKITPDQIKNLLLMTKNKAVAAGQTLNDYVTSGQLKNDLRAISTKAGEIGAKAAAEAEKLGLTKEEIVKKMNSTLSTIKDLANKAKSKFEELKGKYLHKEDAATPAAPATPAESN